MFDVMSSSEEQRVWHRRSYLSRDKNVRCDALRLSALASYQAVSLCLLFDPDNQAEVWLAQVHEKMQKERKSNLLPAGEWSE